MYDFKEFKEVFENWDNHNDGDKLYINNKEVIIVEDYNKGYDSDGECEELLIISIDGDFYATIRYSASYESCLGGNLYPVTKKTKTIEYWE